MEKYMKNLAYESVLPFSGQVSYLEGQVASKTIAQNEALSLTLFAFDKGEEISTHESEGDALVIALDGAGEVTIDGNKHILHAGESIVMPARHPHAVFAQERFKMFLVVVFPQKGD
ncbi:cupin domain-containing protein [Christensenella timonensis]|uniref:cupin domain-containing protein n=1 Tax=Christensenella timonensis TaxID=1816678 RepID=UPI0008334B52|nr:cupin domain-containing protein [Christensenella timonensis]